MPVPGLGGAPGGLTAVISASSTTPVDLATLLNIDGSSPVAYILVVESGVTQGSNDVSVPAIDGTTLHADSSGVLIVNGEVVGKGGDGSYIPPGAFFLSYSPGGAGGGAGSIVGAGGTGIAPGTDGADGTATTGGAAGVTNVGTPCNADTAVNGENGGDAFKTNHAVTAVVSGSIRGGGGGGGFTIGGYAAPDAGGDLDADGAGDAGTFGLKGNAVRLVGSGSFSYSGGGTVGTVGA